VRVPAECYQLEATIGAFLPELRPAQRLGLALWVYGAVLAGSACQVAVLAALLPLGGSVHGLRQRLREWLYDGADRAAPCATQLDVAGCFAPLLRWAVAWWQGTELALAVDATTLGQRVVVLTVSVLYRGAAIPVAWHVRPATAAGAWMPPILDLLDRLAPAVPAGWTVLVLSDRGLWSPRLDARIRQRGWHPLLRLQGGATVRPAGQRRRVRARALVPGPGHAWVGAGVVFRDRAKRRAGTVLVVWDADQAEPWVLLTDLPPGQVGVCWYGLRAWIELGFRALKGLGWRWERTRRTDPERVARHALVLAVATLWALAYGTRAEDAAVRGVAPANLRVQPPPPPPGYRRRVSVFLRGLLQLRWQLLRVRRLWARVWLAPEAWPDPPPDLVVTRVPTPPGTAHARYLPL
jgi:hypothetical protein